MIELHGKKCIYLRNNSQDVIVSFNCHNGHPNYFKYNSLYTDNKYDYIFLNDKNTWYLDDDKGETYQQILKTLLETYDKKRVTFFGSSMGAYGALYHGLLLGANVIASNPQINKHVTLKHDVAEKDNYCMSLTKVNLVSIDDLLKSIPNIESAIHLIFGNFKADVENLKHLLQSFPYNGKVIIEKLPYNSHDYYIHENEELYSRHEILKQLRLTKTSYRI